MRPVERDPVAEQPAEEFVDRDAEGLGLDVPQGDVHRGEDLHPLRNPRPPAVPQPLVEQFDLERVHPDQAPAHDLERGGE